MDRPILIVDVEATCVEDRSPAFDQEIIEIGAVITDPDNGKIISSFQSFVRPIVNPDLSDFCLSLTGIKQSEIDSAILFSDVYSKFDHWRHSNSPSVFCSWGSFDFIQMQKDCLRNGVKPTFLELPYIDLSSVFKKATGKVKGHNGALKHLNMNREGSVHRGLSDSLNIARIVKQMVDRKWIDFLNSHE